MTHEQKCLKQLKQVGKEVHGRLLNMGFTKSESSELMLGTIKKFKAEINKGLTILITLDS